MISAWRLVKKKFRTSAFDGEGARRAGGRWNHQGNSVVYVSGSLALAALETFIHLGVAGRSISHVAIQVQIPVSVAIESVADKSLPSNWRKEPPPDSTKSLGTKWILEARTAVLRVPSVIVPIEWNYLLNPMHPDFKRFVVSLPQDFQFDPRLWKS